MKFRRLRTASLAVLTTALIAPFAPAAQAATPALAAPGGAFRVFAENPPKHLPAGKGVNIAIPPEASAASCSQGPNGTIRGKRVMLTAGHCLQEEKGSPKMGNEVTVPVNRQYLPIGTRGKVHKPTDYENTVWPHEFFWDTINTDDWGIVQLHDGVPATSLSQSKDAQGRAHGAPVQLRSIRDRSTLPHNTFSTDNFGEPICKDGATTGRSCGTQIGRSRNGVYSWGLNYDFGDSGGINYDPSDGAVVGVTSMGLGPLGKAQPADRIIETAYGVPDGKVNEEFKLEDSTAPHTNFTPLDTEQKQITDTVRQNNPDLPIYTPEEAWNKAIETAQADAAVVADRAGKVDSVESAQKLADTAAFAANHHAAQLTATGVNYALSNVAGMSSSH
ncbi:S1 family peptidase [Corynebacterium sp. p3-SID1056]|uniref:S1 family peptidase n=1 Tax=Corynebacterium sp. p3-SID1056 TaxID=2916092 RepID=UPI0021A53177|nr:S1 family peptidase [Corynebacterium sp. p3-SID1056]MCT2339322.1 S1 family peptidase [Corynebacterium sp. p3-SID1056]